MRLASEWTPCNLYDFPEIELSSLSLSSIPINSHFNGICRISVSTTPVKDADNSLGTWGIP